MLSQNQGRANEGGTRPCGLLGAPGLRWECNATEGDGPCEASFCRYLFLGSALGGFWLVMS